MKRNLIYRTYLVMAIIGLIVISCKKDENMTTPPSTKPAANSQPVKPSVSVVDYGMENGNVRTMRAVLNTSGFSVTDTVANVKLSGNSAKVAVSFYVNDDEIIPTGEYSYSNSELKTPFTFDTADLINATDSVSHEFISGSIFKGKIIVTQDGYNYKFDLNCDVVSGKKLTANYNGSVNYLDENVN